MQFGVKVPCDLFGRKRSVFSKIICESFGGQAPFLSFLGGLVDVAELGVVGQDFSPTVLQKAVKFWTLAMKERL